MQTEQRSFASERSDVRPLWVSDRAGKTPPPLGARSTVQSDLHVVIVRISLMTRPSSDCGSRAKSTRLVLEGGRVAAARDQHGLKRSKGRYLAVLRGMPLFGPVYEKGNRANFALSRKPPPAYIDAVRLATCKLTTTYGGTPSFISSRLTPKIFVLCRIRVAPCLCFAYCLRVPSETGGLDGFGA